MKDNIWKRIGFFFLSILVLVYVGYQIYKSTYVAVKTETAIRYSLSEILAVDAYAFRQERVLQSAQKTNAVRYLWQEGEKVAQNRTVAQFYSDVSDISLQEQISELKEEISLLQGLNELKESTDIQPENIDNNIDDKVINILTKSRQNALTEINSLRSSLLYSVSERQMVVGTIENFDDRITQLQLECAKLERSGASARSSIATPVSGYFFQTVDGYEKTFVMDDVEKMTLSEWNELKNQPAEISPSAVGKMMTSHQWYLACKVSAADSLRIDVSDKVKINIFSVSNTAIDAKVVAINREDRVSDCIVVLECNTINADLAKFRFGEVQIVLGNYTGLCIDKNVVQFVNQTVKTTDAEGNTVTEEKKVEGVYILYGNQIFFREIVPLYTQGNLLICEQNPQNTVTKNILKLYDEVVVSGRNLEDGKYIN